MAPFTSVSSPGLRAIEIDDVRSSLPSGATDSQHDLRLAFGITYHLHR
jgi:hypothetical protein